MALMDLDLGNLLQSQYNNEPVFDYSNTIEQVTFALKRYADCTVIPFEGSRDLLDWLSNFRARMIQVDGLGGVEEGFFTGLPDVMDVLWPMIPKDKPLYVTGHSRGASHTNLFVVMLLNKGFPASLLKRVAIASPRSGDAVHAERLLTIEGRTYRNYHNEDAQDFVCDVPLHFNFMPYERPQPTILVDVPPLPNDPWLLFARHHLNLYLQGIANAGQPTS
jgi:hypothetical protein